MRGCVVCVCGCVCGCVVCVVCVCGCGCVCVCVCVSLDNSGVCHSATVYHYASFPAASNTLGIIASNEAPLLALHFSKSHTEVHTENRHLRGKRERNGAQKLQELHDASIGAAVVTKRHVSGQSDVERLGNQACSFSHYQVTLV